MGRSLELQSPEIQERIKPLFESAFNRICLIYIFFLELVHILCFLFVSLVTFIQSREPSHTYTSYRCHNSNLLPLPPLGQVLHCLQLISMTEILQTQQIRNQEVILNTICPHPPFILSYNSMDLASQKALESLLSILPLPYLQLRSLSSCQDNICHSLSNRSFCLRNDRCTNLLKTFQRNTSSQRTKNEALVDMIPGAFLIFLSAMSLSAQAKNK